MHPRAQPKSLMNSGKGKMLKELAIVSKEVKKLSYLGCFDYKIKSCQNTQDDLQPCPFPRRL